MPKAITAKQIDTILLFLEIFEKPDFSCGNWTRHDSDKPNHFIMPIFDYVEPVCRFEQCLYDNGWIEPFDWGQWRKTAA